MWGQGRGYFSVRKGWGRAEAGERSGGGGRGAFHSLKPEWDLSMLYGLLHTTVWGELESFTEQPPPLGAAVKVKV